MKPRFPVPGVPPATLLRRSEAPAAAPEFTVVEYAPDFYEEQQFKTVEELPVSCGEGHTRWIEMNGTSDVDALRAFGEKYHLHPLALEDTVNVGQRAKVEVYDEHLFILMHMVYHDEQGQLCTEQTSLFLKKDLLISIQEEPKIDVFDPVRERLRTGKGQLRKCRADYLTYALLDSIIDHLFPVLEAIGTTIEEIEDDLLDKPNRGCAAKIHQVKRLLMRLRRCVWPERDIVNFLLHDESGIIGKQTKIYLRDCYDHTVQAMDFVESYRDVSSGLMEMYLSALGMRTNEIMRVLTVISAIFIPLTFIVGLYGMNFDYANGAMPLNMPELHHPHGYLVCVGVMALISIGQIIFFKRKGWL